MAERVIACVGVGNIGRAWAIAFARGGCIVRLYDSNAEALSRSTDLIAKSVADLAAAEMIDNADQLLARISICQSVEETLDGADHVQESIVENLELKIRVFGELDALADPRTILATSSSEFMSSQIIGEVKHTERVLVAHPFNPPYLIPLVEISGHEGTDPQAIQGTRDLLEGIGMAPVVVKKEIKAFLLNRLQAAVVAESLYLVGNGYCSAEDLDRAMTNGLALRWAFIGPFMTGHLNASGGYRDYMRDDGYGGTYRRMISDLANASDWDYALPVAVSEEMERTIPTAEIADGQRWRDKRLMALLKHKREEADYE
ncbi:MAG: 3-hydroxyacyl-CoA dehydrogenase NAD-binding domain-containing protein [Sphingorhabdus sp.]